MTTLHENDASRNLASSFAEQMTVVESLIGEWSGHDRCSVALTSPTLSMEVVGDRPDPDLIAGAAAVRSLSDDASLLIVQDGHRSDTVEASFRLGLLGPRAVLSHAVGLNESHIELIARAAASVAHNPSAKLINGRQVKTVEVGGVLERGSSRAGHGVRPSRSGTCSETRRAVGSRPPRRRPRDGAVAPGPCPRSLQ